MRWPPFHSRPLAGDYKALILDGVVVARKTGAGALRHPVLVALGLRHDGKKEIIDFQLATSENERAWERFFNSLYKRGLTGERFGIICVDGGKGLLAAVYAGVPVQRCWAHKIRNVLDKAKKANHDEMRDDLRAIMNAKTAHDARSHARDFAGKDLCIIPRLPNPGGCRCPGVQKGRQASALARAAFGGAGLVAPKICRFWQLIGIMQRSLIDGRRTTPKLWPASGAIEL